MAPFAAALAAVLALAAAREALAAVGRPRPMGLGRAAGKISAAAITGAAGLSIAPGLPARLTPVVAIALPVAGFLLPDALSARAARRRTAAALAALPDALDLLAVGVAAGRSAERVMGEIAAATSGPLAAELRIALAEIECGSTQADALAAMARRVPGPELAAVGVALERSRVFGSPLADQLSDQARALRSDARSALAERAARAAPKIQLVVALLLVPSVLLMLLAALIAHAGALLPGY